jgi:predicted KAP-like P-loop ATPase
MKFIIDKEIDLNKQDFLNTSSYSKALREVINSSPKDNTFTIGLFGEWGSGKSSIVKTVEEEFNKTKKVKFIIYDSWKYSNDSFRRMFLLKLQEDLGFNKTEKFESFYRNKTSDLSINRKIEWKYLIFTFIVFVLGIAVILNLPPDQTEFKITLAVLVAFLGILIKCYRSCF